MSRFIWLCVAIIAASASPASGQVDTSRRDAERPFVRGGIYDKPYLATLLGRSAIGGYAEAHARWEQVEGLTDEATFEAKRFNLFASSRVSDIVRIGAELEFEDGGREINLEYAAIDFLVHPRFAIRGGMLLSPLGRFNLAHDSPLNEFTDRPLVSTGLLGTALSEPGFGVFGQVPVTRIGRFTYESYVTNGFSDGLITASEDGTRIALGRGNFEDNNASPAFVGRVALSRGVDHEIGFSAHRGAYNVFSIEGTSIDRRRDLSIAVIDGESRLLGVRLAGEAAIATIDVPDGLSGIYADRQHGWYVEGVRPFGGGWLPTMPRSELAAKLRWDYVDFDARRRGHTTAQLTAGINFRPTAESVLKLDYVQGRARDEFNNLSKYASVFVSMATYF
ncbi:MAG TPA: hypothetical protein VIP11_27205 [Gemmatimonadaceae bacterium]